MQFLSAALLRALLLLSALALPAPSASAQSLALTVTPNGTAVADRPLPPGAKPAITFTLRNTGKTTVGPVLLEVRLERIGVTEPDGWRAQDGVLRSEFKSIAAGGSAERTLRLRVEIAPLSPADARILAEARSGGHSARADLQFRTADCAGAYRARLASLRETLAQPVRDAADAMRKPDAALPAGRLFPAARMRGAMGNAERLASSFAARRGADPQLSTEWFRFLLARWASELNAYAGQAPNPGLCANNYYQIAGYRQGLLPITRHIDATHGAAATAIDALRKEGENADSDVGAIVRSLAAAAGIDEVAENGAPLASLAAIRATMRSGRKIDPGLLRKLSLAETAAWLAEADARGRKLVDAIEQTLAAIAAAHKETCVCAL